MKNITFLIFLLTFQISFSQVGIGTENPQAVLHINTTPNGVAALRLEPQTTPIGTTTGQISVINDKLYMFDATRRKWLSVEATKYSFGLEDGANNENIEYNGDVQNSGPIIPYDGTIVYIAMNSSGGQPDKGVQMIINNLNVPNSANSDIDGLIELNNNQYLNTDYDLDVREGDSVRFRVTLSPQEVRDLTVDIWIKWRK